MIFEIFHLIFLLGWLGDMLLLIYCLNRLIALDIKFLFYPALYIFVEFVEYLPFFDNMSNFYTGLYKSYFKYDISLNRVNSVGLLNSYFKYDSRSGKCINTTSYAKKEIVMLGPHGMFMTAPICSGIFTMNKQFKNSYKLFVAPILSYNPIINLVSKLINKNKVEALTYKNVIKNLTDRTHNLCVSPGGFDEINMYGNNNVIYTGRWKFWIKNAIKHGYNISFCHCLGGDQDYVSILGDKFLPLRKKMASFQIPFNIVYGKFLIFPFNNVKMTEIYFDHELPHIPNVKDKTVDLFYNEFLIKLKNELIKVKPLASQNKIVIM
jgi:hypothetical protein